MPPGTGVEDEWSDVVLPAQAARENAETMVRTNSRNGEGEHTHRTLTTIMTASYPRNGDEIFSGR
ncbi:hypothetical protein GCM10023318_54530 [Nocardia callitridis]|uniref:Uncharacterized protein n=1 Tax=Nocardia callitridis TaxID=648753 RepID=A0ABP9KYI4_9NOCA